MVSVASWLLPSDDLGGTEAAGNSLLRAERAARKLVAVARRVALAAIPDISVRIWVEKGFWVEKGCSCGS